MMPVIRITDATWERLKKWAIPLEDTPEDAVRKILDAAEKHINCQQIPENKQPNEKLIPIKNKLKRGQKTPQYAYRLPILESLHELGGKAPVTEILDLVKRKMESHFAEVDYLTIPTGDIRWRNTAMWERHEMVKDGLLKSNSPKGVWELSEKGLKEIQKSVK